MDNDKIDQHSDEIEVESEEKERGKKIEIDEDRLPSRAMAIHEHIRQDGEKELERDAMALLWSAIAAGLSMGASLLAKGIFQVELEGVPGSFLSVGDHYHGLALHQLLKGQLNQIFIVRVGKCRGLVQEHNGSVL